MIGSDFMIFICFIPFSLYPIVHTVPLNKLILLGLAVSEQALQCIACGLSQVNIQGVLNTVSQ